MDPKTEQTGQAAVVDVFGLSPDPILLLDSEGRVRELNPAARGQLAPPLNPSPEWNFRQLIADEPAARVAEACARLGAGEPVSDLCGRWPAPDGGSRWYQWRTARVDGGLMLAIGRDITRFVGGGIRFSVAEQVSRYPGAAHEEPCCGSTDTSEQRRLVQQLAEAEAQARCVIELSFDVVVLQCDQVIVELNAKGAEMIGAESPESMVGRPIFDLFAPEYHQVVAERIKGAIESGEPTPLSERKLLRHDGSTIDVEGAAVPTLYQGRRATYAVFRDISARKAAERALRTREHQFRTLARVAPVGIFQTDATMTLVYMNGRFAEISGREACESLTLDWALLVHPDDRESFRRTIERARQFCRPLRHEHRLCHPQRQLVWVSCQAVPEFSEEGALLGWIGTLSDITEAKSAQAELTAYQEQLETMVARRTRELERLNDELESFNYTVSHDLRAPLRAMSGFASALREDYGGQFDAIGLRYIDRIHANAAHMAGLIENLLELSRVSQQELVFEAVDMTGLAHSVVAELEEGEPERQVTVRIEEGLEAWADPRLLRCLLQNLIGNAWKYTGLEAEPLIEFGRESILEGGAVFYVRDNGVGFSMGAGTALFRPFQRLHPASEFEGNGVGLATVQRIVNRFGGRVWAEGHEGEGAIFRFELPGAPVEPE